MRGSEDRHFSARPSENFPRLMSLYKAGCLKPDELITQRYRIDEAPQAFDDLTQCPQHDCLWVV